MSLNRFILSRADEGDIPEITRVEYECFPPVIRELFMGCKSEADLPLITAKNLRDRERDPHDIWIKVVDSTTGKIVAASNWKVFLNSGAPNESDEVPPEWLEGEVLEKASKIMGVWNEARRKENPGPHIHLHICFTDPDYRRQGLGSMMMQWGCDLADQLFLPGWIEASSEGNFLYKKFGFYDYMPMGAGMSGMCMRRDAKKVA
ncbi:acyl-CoA N-acyltransferase [Hypomontagnella monticulosa]|nr:acyl-CoA N-acyltransferase [Hypomontagnella monticulosa]